jgi:hypothetical protein
MKVSKHQLRAIIKEEKSKLLSEQLHGSGRNQNVMEQLHTAIDALIGAMGSEEARVELQGIVDEWDTGGQYNEGSSLEHMPASWQQILGTCLKETK